MSYITTCRLTCLALLGLCTTLGSCSFSETQYVGPDKVKVKEGGVIIKADKKAGKAAENYQGDYPNNNYSVYFSKAQLEEFIKNSGKDCTGFRVYRTINNDGDIDDEGVIGMVIVSVEIENGKKIDVTTESKKLANAQALVSYDICPNNCDRESIFCVKE